MAKVTKEFDGCPDGEVHPKSFKPGDIVEGDLARVAIENGWAEGSSEPSGEPKKRRRGSKPA
jgi:hypothetical protein